MFSLIYAGIIGWANNREAGDLRRHRTHYDVIVMQHIEDETTLSPFYRRCFQMQIVQRKLWILLKISLKFVSDSSIGSLGPSRLMIVIVRGRIKSLKLM